MADETASKKPEPGPLSIARDVVTLSAIVLFFAGFVFRSFLQSELGAPKAEAPIYDFVTSSWTVFQNAPAAFGLPAAGLLGLYALRKLFAARLKPSPRQWYLSVETALLVALVVFAFDSIYDGASSTAKTVALQTRKGQLSDAIEFNFAAAVLKKYPELRADSAADALHVVGRDDDYIYILDQPDMTDPVIPSGAVYAIKLSDIDSYKELLP